MKRQTEGGGSEFSCWRGQASMGGGQGSNGGRGGCPPSPLIFGNPASNDVFTCDATKYSQYQKIHCLYQ